MDKYLQHRHRMHKYNKIIAKHKSLTIISAKTPYYEDAFALISEFALSYFSKNTIIAIIPLRNKVMAMQSILISEIFSSICLMTLFIVLFTAFSTSFGIALVCARTVLNSSTERASSLDVTPAFCMAANLVSSAVICSFIFSAKSFAS